jgi:tetratricopeptide (TPR) repeat protein
MNAFESSAHRSVIGGLLLAIVAAGWSLAAQAQLWDPRALEGDPVTAKAPLAPRLTGLGPLTHPISSTRNAESQAFFTQGMNLVYAYNHPEAVRAFKESARLDPENPMAWWGQALALGPNLNLPMQPEAVGPAYAASRKALALKARANGMERALIEALAERYSDDPEADRATLDRAWADALARVVAEYPDHTGVATLYADALMNLSPWNYWTPDGEPREHTATVLKTLESVLAKVPDHPGALHLYIHALEAVDPARAEPAADRLARLTPGAGHLVHMPTHIYMWRGRYQEAYQLNAQAIAADEGYLAQCRAQGIYPLLYYPHNIHFMVWAAMFEGRSATALADARKIAAHNHVETELFGLPELFEQQPLYVLARFGRWEEVLNEPRPPAQARLMNALWHYARGLAYRHRGDIRGAQEELESLRRIAAEPDMAEKYTAFAPTLTLIRIAEEVLAGEIAAGQKRYGEAISHLERAVRLQDGTMYNEPPEWFFPVRHYLGAVLLEAGLPGEAETVYWQDLRQNRENGYALFGLHQALKAQGRDGEAEAVKARLDKAWARADVKLTSSRF